jgi:hypothetical protein
LPLVGAVTVIELAPGDDSETVGPETWRHIIPFDAVARPPTVLTEPTSVNEADGGTPVVFVPCRPALTVGRFSTTCCTAAAASSSPVPQTPVRPAQ